MGSVMILAAISLAAMLHHPAPTVTCQGGAAVSYKFVGAPGTQFTYTGKQYVVPPRGWIELIGHGPDSRYAAKGRDLPLDTWPIDEFGTRTVSLPQTSNEGGLR